MVKTVAVEIQTTHSAKSFFRPIWVIPVGLLLVLIGCFAAIKFVLGARVNARIKEIRAQHLPVTAADLNYWQAIFPARDNAAFTVIEAAHLVRADPPKVGDGKWRDSGANLSPGQEAELVQTLSVNSDALVRLNEGLQKKFSRYPVDWSRGPATLIPYISEIHRLSDLLACKALLATYQRDATNAVAAIRALLSLSSTLETDPITISQSSRLSLIATAVTHLQLLINRVTLNGAEIHQLQSAFENLEKGTPNPFTVGLVGERAIAIYIFQAPPREMSMILYDGGAQTFPLLYVALRASGVIDADFLHFLGISALAIKAAQLPFPAALDTIAKVQQRASENRSAFHLVSNVVLPDYEKAFLHHATVQARRRLALTALAIEEFRLQSSNNSYPKSIDEIPNLPLDPFTGLSLHYHLLPRGFLLYSVGPDRIDNGGIPPENAKHHGGTNGPVAIPPIPQNGQSGDILFTVEHSEPGPSSSALNH